MHILESGSICPPPKLSYDVMDSSKAEKGRHFTEAEIDQFHEGRHIYGTNWEKIAAHVGTRDAKQVRSLFYRLGLQLDNAESRDCDEAQKSDHRTQDSNICCSYQSNDRSGEKAHSSATGHDCPELEMDGDCQEEPEKHLMTCHTASSVGGKRVSIEIDVRTNDEKSSCNDSTLYLVQEPTGTLKWSTAQLQLEDTSEVEKMFEDELSYY